MFTAELEDTCLAGWLRPLDQTRLLRWGTFHPSCGLRCLLCGFFPSSTGAFLLDGHFPILIWGRRDPSLDVLVEYCNYTLTESQTQPIDVARPMFDRIIDGHPERGGRMPILNFGCVQPDEWRCAKNCLAFVLAGLPPPHMELWNCDVPNVTQFNVGKQHL